ncbi:uncharacterized protein LOC120186165 [Hibiscus syriacus]|nr:uncharacterized protein LOC120186165 [Hibiscus syriacus]
MAYSSSKVYYGGASVAIPFDWESHPGTPKHPSSDTVLRPLAPPPSYHSSMKSKPMTKKSLKPSTVLGSIFRKLIAPRKNHASSPSASLSWSPLHGSSSSFSSFMNRKILHRRRSYFSCSCPRSHIHNCMDDDDGDDNRIRSPVPTLCFGFKAKPRNQIEFKGSQSMTKMKKALLSD